MDKIHEFLTGLRLIEGSAEVTGCGNGVLFFYPSHLHTHVTGLNHDHHTKRMQGLLNALLDLQRHTFLYLQTM